MKYKVFNLIIILVVIEFSLFLFTLDVNPEDIAEGRYAGNSTSIFQTLLSPQGWEANSFLSWLWQNKIALVAGLSTIFIGSLVVSRKFAWKAGLFTGTFLGFGAVIIHLWNFLYNINLWDNTGVALVMATVLVSPLLLYFILTTIEYLSEG